MGHAYLISDEQQSTTDEIDQPKPQRNQQPNASNNQSNTAAPIRPSQLHTQQMKQQQQQQQQPPPSQTASSNPNVPPPLTLPIQDDHSSSHESINPNQADSTMHLTNAPIYTQHATGTTYVDSF